MWPMLLNLTHDECRRTLRRLELEAYSNMISVFRAQGALEDNRKKLLEELRAVLHISNDRHSAEARRVSNDELLATIAEQLSGPNTGLGWISEGRRRVPLLPRGVAQTMYTEIADKAAEAAAAENKEIIKKLEADKLVAPKSNEEEMSEAEGETAEGGISSNETDDMLYPPVAMEDQTKLWDTEIMCRKRKLPEGGAIPDDAITPVKNMRNIPVNTNQKHLNLSQIYSKFSQPASSKPSGQSKHSYNQVSKVSTSKSTQSHTQRQPHKHRSHKGSKSAHAAMSKAQMKKHQEMPMSPGKQYNPTSMQLDYAGPPNTFQASYAQSVLGSKTKPEYAIEDNIKLKGLTSPGMMADSPTMQLLTQPATVPHELGVSDNVHPDDPSSLQAKGMPTTKVGNKPCHLVIKKRGEATQDKKVQMSEIKLLQKPSEGIKIISNRQVVVNPSTTPKTLTPGKLVATKVMSSIPKGRTPGMPAEKMIVVSKPSSEIKTLPSSKILITSSVSTPSKDNYSVSTNSISPKTTETFTPKGIPTTDLKVSAKAVVLNPKSGQKMVVLPANKARTKPGPEKQIPLLHFKGLSTAMKLVPVSSQPTTPVSVAKSATLTVMSKPTVVSAVPSSTKFVNVEPIKTANLADIVPVKGMTPITTPKITNPIVRPASAKGSVIVVQKGTPIGKALTFSKNGNDMSKIIMGKNINQLLQASKTDPTESSKCAGNVIVLELNNEQTGRTTTMSEILESRTSNVSRPSDEPSKISQITQDTPVLFENPITDETCNASSLDSTADSIGGIEPIEDSSIVLGKEVDKSGFSKDVEGGKDSSSVTDWEMELDTVSRKGKDDDDKLNSLHLDLGMSSDSENEYMVDSHKSKGKHSSQESIPTATVGGEPSEIYGSTSGLSLATRTLLSQLQDDGSSSNDSSFALKSKSTEKPKDSDSKIDKSECDALTKAKEKLSEKVKEAKSQQKRIDIYSTAISSSDINLDSFSYLAESIMAGDDVLYGEEPKGREMSSRRADALHDQLSRLLGEDSANSTDSQTVSETLPLSK